MILIVVGSTLFSRKLKQTPESDQSGLPAFWIVMYPACVVATVTLFMLVEGYDAKGVSRVLLLRDTWPETGRYRFWLAFAYLFTFVMLLVQLLPVRRPTANKSAKSKTEN